MRPRLVGINHVALEVGDVDVALELYGRLFDLDLRGRMKARPSSTSAISSSRWWRPALARRRTSGSWWTTRRRRGTRSRKRGAEIVPGRGLNFRDPFGNLVQVVQYDEIQFTKSDRILEGMGLELGKTERALGELREKGLA